MPTRPNKSGFGGKTTNMNDLQLLKPDNFPDKKQWSDLEWVEEFYQFLQGVCPKSITIESDEQPKLSEKQAYNIIWYLQEHLPVFPDNICKCSICSELYNSHNAGWYSGKTGKHYCDHCDTYTDDGHQEEENY